MRQVMMIVGALSLVTLTTGGSSGASVPALLAAVPDEVINWNIVATTVTPATGKNGPQQTRVYAMAQIAVHDALNAIDARYEAYT